MHYYVVMKADLVQERRALERFSLKLPARMELLSTEKCEVYDLVTTDISANGAYFPMVRPISKDTRVRVTLTISSQFLKRITGCQGVLILDGTVVRTEPKGIAVRFDENNNSLAVRFLH